MYEKESQGIQQHTKLFLVDLLKQPETVGGMTSKKRFLVGPQRVAEFPQRSEYLQRLFHIRVL